MDKIFILDWDDTLLCTSRIEHEAKKQNINIYHMPLSYKLKYDLKCLEQEILNLLYTLKSYGKIYILTNADMKWFIYSCLNFTPDFYKILTNFTVISALDEWKKDFPDIVCIDDIPTESTGTDWKYNSMKKIMEINKDYKDKCIISIGDSIFEKDAAIKLKLIDQYKNYKIITIKMIEVPDFDIIMLQINSISNNIKYFLKNENNNILSF